MNFKCSIFLLLFGVIAVESAKTIFFLRSMEKELESNNQTGIQNSAFKAVPEINSQASNAENEDFEDFKKGGSRPGGSISCCRGGGGGIRGNDATRGNPSAFIISASILVTIVKNQTLKSLKVFK